MKYHWFTKYVVRLFVMAAVLLPTLARAQSKDDFRVTLTGDSNWHRRISVYDDPAYLELIERMKSADARFTNFETLIHPINIPANPWAGGGYAYAPPWMVDEIKWVGFNLLSVANNHAFDYGAEGLLDSIHALDAAGIVNAGGGENLAFARAPAYLDTKHGRVAFIACVSSLREGSLAGQQRPDLRGRPGVNPFRFTTTYTVDQATFDSLRKVAALRGPEGFPPESSQQVLNFAGARYQVGDKIEVHTEPNPDDLAGLLASIRAGHRQAEWVIVSIHAHEGAGPNREGPAEFLVTFAHAAIDAGADVFVAHGPQTLKGIEIYKGKPIFYSLGNFVFDGEAGIPFLPAESFESQHLPWEATTADFRDASSKNDTYGYPADKKVWQNLVAEVSFSPDHKLTSLVLEPIELGYGKSRTQRGHPLPASPKDAQEIIGRVTELSAKLGTKVDFVGGRGVVNVNQYQTQK
jgi:poly-gamma-glutamate capsule biosynthesis protein CapA/YwtB (metallophosphatase superfamily)